MSHLGRFAIDRESVASTVVNAPGSCFLRHLAPTSPLLRSSHVASRTGCEATFPSSDQPRSVYCIFSVIGSVVPLAGTAHSACTHHRTRRAIEPREHDAHPLHEAMSGWGGSTPDHVGRSCP